MKKILSIFLLIALALGGTVKADEVTIADGTVTNAYVPLYGYYCDQNGMRSQMIYPASELTSVQGKSITGITFYSSTASWANTATFKVSLAEVEAETLDALNTTADFTEVKGTGTLPVDANNKMEITFDEPFTYSQGKNILVDVTMVAKGKELSKYFYGISATSGSSIIKYGSYSSATKQAFLPKATFTYEAPAAGPALKVLDGTTKISSGYSYSFGLATAGTTKTFTLSNPGTEATPVAVAHTGSFEAVLSAASIPAGGEVTLTVTMPAASGSDVITISSTVESIDNFVINVRGTVRDASKFSETLLGGSIPEDWTSTGTWNWNTTNGASNTAWSESSNYRLITPQLTVAEGESFFFEVQGTYDNYQGIKFEYSTDKTTWTASSTTTSVNSSWQTFEINDVPAGKYYIALHGWHVNIRNFYGGYVPSTPKDITLDSKTTTSLTLSWTPAGSETAWKLEYSTNSDLSSSTIVDADSNPFELTGLDHSTKYYVRVRANAEGAEWSKVADFQTECGTYTIDATHTFKADFDKAELNAAPTCWEFINATATSLSTYPHIAVRAESGYFKGEKSLHFRNNSSKLGYAIFPVIENLSHSQITFSHREENTTNGGFLVLGYLTDIEDASTFDTLFVCTPTQSFREEDGIILSSVPDGARLAFQYQVKTSYYDAAVDDITVSLAPACAKPSDVKTTALDSVSATITWLNGGEETSWKLQYSTDNTNWTAANEGNAFTSKPFVLNGLTASTKYYVQVKAICGTSDESDWSASGEFTTDCNAIDELNEAFSSSLPDCWKVSKTGGDYSWAVNSSYRVSASYSMNYYATAATTEYSDLITPNVNLGDKESNLTFYLKNDGYSGSVTAEVYIVVGETTTKLVDLGATSGWALQTIDLTDYVGKTAKFIFRAHGLGAYSNIYIDDVAVVVKPCAKPTGLAAVKGNASAEISWTDESASEWNLRYRIVAEPENEWTTVNGLTAKPHTLESLTNGSEYEVQVQAACSATRTSDWTASVKFTPEACPTITSVTLGAKTYNSVVVNWATSSASNCDVRYKAGEGEWTTVADIAATTKTLEGLTTGAVYTIAVKPSCGDDEAWVAAADPYTPVYSIPANAAVASITDATATASWDAVSDTPNGYKYIFVAKDAEPEWASATATNELSAALAGLEVSTDYDFYVAAVYGANLGDAAKVSFKTVTVAPKNFTQVALGATTATYSWEKDGANTTFEYSLDGENWNSVATYQVTLNDLTANTAYTLYVRSVYDGELRSANASVAFRTECGAVSALSWTGGSFEGETGAQAPSCWTVYSPNEYPYVNTWYPHAGTYHLWFQNGGSTGKEQIAALPEFTEDIKTLKMSFYYHNNGYTSSYYPSLEVGVMSDVNDSASFRTLVVLNKTSSYNAQPIEVLFNGATASEKYIAFRLAGGTYDGRATIDDITFSEAPTCFAPALGETTILPDGATFTWTAGNGETNFQYAIDTTETLVWTATDETTVTVHGFAPGTQRKFYVRAFCNPEVSESVWTAFTPECPAPAKVDTVDGTLTTNAVSIHWTAAAGITNYQYSVVAKNASADWTKAVLVENATTAELSGLSASTEYTVYVRSYYSAISQSSAVSVNFATECAAIAELNENFSEKATGALPLCWDAEGASSYVTIASSGYSAFDGNGLYFTGSTNYVYVLLPEFSVALNTMQISFKHNVEDTGKSGRVELGYYKEGAFTQIKECEETAAKTWVNEGPIALTAVPAGARIAFAYKATTSTYTAVVDNIKVEAIPSCAVPTGLAASNVTDFKATLTWASEAGAFKVQYTDDKENWGAEHDADAASYAIEGLMPNTVYYARVKAVCDSEHSSEWCEEISFKTECAAEDMLSEDFSAGIPECWKTSGSWSVSAAGQLSYSANAASEITTVAVNVIEEEAILQFDLQNSYSRTGRVIIKASGKEDFSTDFGASGLQTIDLSAYNGATITITFQVDAFSGLRAIYIDNVKVIVKPCDTPKNLDIIALLDSAVLSWEQGGEETRYQYSVVKFGEEADWKTLEDGVRTVTVKGLDTDTLYTASVRSYCGETRVGETVLTADFTPLCPQPSDIVITNITANGVKASWTPAEGIAKYQWSLVEDEWLDKNIVEATSVDLGGLEAATDYTLYVRSYFSATSVSAPISQVFTTACDIYGMPFEQNFDALVSGIPTCWDNSEGTTSTASYKWNYYQNGHDGACVRFESYSNNNGNTNVLVTPSIVISSENPALSFYFKNPDGGAYTVEINDGTSTNVLVGEGMTGIGEWTQKIVELDAYQGKTVQFRFCGTSNSAPYGSDGYLYLDDVLVDKKSDIPTAINFVGADDAKVIKLIENDQLVIIRDGIKYNAQGKRLGE